MATDFTKSANEILIDLINTTNSTALVPASVTFGPVAPTVSGNKNTGVKITAVNGSGYKGERDLTYDRVDIATVPGSRSTTFQKGDALKISDLIPEINTAYGLNLTADDYVDADLPVFAGTDPAEVHTVNLVAKAGSYIFTGTLELTVDGNDVDLATIITITELDGLHYPVV